MELKQILAQATCWVTTSLFIFITFVGVLTVSARAEAGIVQYLSSLL